MLGLGLKTRAVTICVLVSPLAIFCRDHRDMHLPQGPIALSVVRCMQQRAFCGSCQSTRHMVYGVTGYSRLRQSHSTAYHVARHRRYPDPMMLNNFRKTRLLESSCQMRDLKTAVVLGNCELLRYFRSPRSGSSSSSRMSSAPSCF